MSGSSIPNSDTGLFVSTKFPSFLASEYNSSIEVLSDADFVSQEWPGSGTESSPYLISNLRFSYPDQEPIIIANTRAHFVVRNCVFEKQGMPPLYGSVNAISIFNASNGIIRDCTISTTGVAIGVSNSSEMMILNNQVRDTEQGFNLESLERSVICNNSLNSGYVGFHTDGLISCNITRNTIVETEWGIVLGEFCVNNSISLNRIGWCEEYAHDYGSGNMWDSNSWSNWNGVGPYIISGTAGSIDESPSLFDEDVLGPKIEFDHPPGLLDSNGVFTFSIIVTDVSGVDSVVIYIRETWWVGDETVRSNWSDFAMQPSEIQNNYTFSFQTNDCWSLSFIVLANDTLGHSRMSDMDSFEVNPHFPTFPPPPPPPPNFQLFIALGILFVLIVTVVINNRSQSTPSSGILHSIRIR